MLRVLLVLSFICAATYCGAEEGSYPAGTPYYPKNYPSGRGTYDDGFVPTPPDSLPDKLRDYQILPASISPDKQYGLLYPQRARVYAIAHPRLLLAELKPFHVLKEIPCPYILAANGHGYYVVNWASDSTAMTVIVGSKWGPEGVYVVPFAARKAGKVTDLTSEVTKLVLPDFKRTKVEPYNDNYDFVFVSNGRTTDDDQGDILSEKGWDPNNHGEVVIDCTCTTEPRPDMGYPVWTVRFHGVWDIAKKHFVSRMLTRVSPKETEPAPLKGKSR